MVVRIKSEVPYKSASESSAYRKTLYPWIRNRPRAGISGGHRSMRRPNLRFFA